MSQKSIPNYYQDVAKNLTSEEIANLRPETQKYLQKKDKGVGEIIQRESPEEFKRQVVERMKKQSRYVGFGTISEEDNEEPLPSKPAITLQDVIDSIYEEYELGRADLEIELDPLIIEEKSAVKHLHILVSTTETDHQKFLYQLNKRMLKQ